MNLEDLSVKQRKALMAKLADDLLGGDSDDVGAEPEAPTKVVAKKVTKKAVKKVIEKANLELSPRAECEDEQEMSIEDFEEICLKYATDNEAFNAAKKAKEAGRETILETMDNKKKFETNRVFCGIGESKNEVIDMALVYDNLEGNELAELFQLGILTVSKPNFERWAKGKGYDPADFTIKRAPKKRLTVKRK